MYSWGKFVKMNDFEKKFEEEKRGRKKFTRNTYMFDFLCGNFDPWIKLKRNKLRTSKI